MGFLQGVYTLVGLVLYLFPSAVLVYHRRVARWLKFSLVFFFVHALGNYVFFGVVSVPEQLANVLEALPLVLFFFGSVACIGFCLVKGWSLERTLGLLALTSLVLVGAATSQRFESAFQGIGDYTRVGVEVASVVAVALGLPLVLGYCLVAGFTARQTIGALIIFVGVGMVVMSTIQLTIGYEYLGLFQS